MKHLIYILIFSAVSIMSCKKIDTVEIFQPGPMTNGKFSAKLNKKAWIASGFASRGKHSIDSSLIGLNASTRYEDTINYLSERFGISYLPNKTGLFTKFTNDANLIKKGGEELICSHSLVEDDQVKVFFQVDISQKTNFVHVTVLDSTHIEGTFDLTFQSQGDKKLVYRFKEGQFNVKFSK
jgi:hypothetical protein